MNRKLRVFLIIISICIVAGGAIAYAMWNKPRRNVADETGLQITAAQLVKDYQANEAAANQKFLDKAIQVTGTITELKQNQDGKSTIMLASDDAFTGVFCTLKQKATSVAPGSTITIKGICSGMLTDVRLREAVIVNNSQK